MFSLRRRPNHKLQITNYKLQICASIYHASRAASGVLNIKRNAMKTLLWLSLLLPAMVVAQERPALTAPAKSIYAGAEGKYEEAPDTAVIQFNISAQENSTQAAYDRASKAAEQVRQVMRSNGIDPKTA